MRLSRVMRLSTAAAVAAADSEPAYRLQLKTAGPLTGVLRVSRSPLVATPTTASDYAWACPLAVARSALRLKTTCRCTSPRRP